MERTLQLSIPAGLSRMFVRMPLPAFRRCSGIQSMLRHSVDALAFSRCSGI